MRQTTALGASSSSGAKCCNAAMMTPKSAYVTGRSESRASRLTGRPPSSQAVPAASVRRWRKCWRREGKSNQLSTLLLKVTIIDSIPAFAWRLQMPILDKLRPWLELCLVLHWRSLLMPQLGIPKSAHSKQSWASSRGLTTYMPVCCIAFHRFCAGRVTDMRASRWYWRKDLDTQ